jgi:hypothetical protein
MPSEAARASRFLDLIDNPARGEIDATCMAFVVAHPDDETIGCGAPLSRPRGVRVIVVTDGAPRDLKDARG